MIEESSFSVVNMRPASADVISRVITSLSFVMLVVYVAIVGSVMNSPPPVRQGFGSLPGFAFWGGVVSSFVLFVVGFFRRERWPSIRTMITAVVLGLLWFFVTFGSLAITWGSE
jgi:ABC-type Fe3+-siderophore transport system permease subunit